MSFHYPHHVGSIRALRSNRERVSDFLSRNPQVTEHEAGEILTFARTRRHLGTVGISRNDRARTNLETGLDHRTRFSVNWSEGSAVLGGLVVLLITAWLIWAALAEAAYALAEAAAYRS
jgi:hypothetical protein